MRIAREPDSAEAAVPVGNSGRGGRHRHARAGSPEFTHDRKARLWVLAGSVFGVGCLSLAQWLHPHDGSLVAAPSGPAAWAALILGCIGIWLVPGLWLSALMLRTGAGPAARLATRIGSTLAWYALAGPVIRASADVQITTGDILGVTVAATAAVCLGVTLGLLRRPTEPGLRVLAAAFTGLILAQNVIGLSMMVFADGVNYEHISRLNWLIVLTCGVLTTIGALSRPELPPALSGKRLRPVAITFAVIAITAAAVAVTGSKWSPGQLMPSAFSIEQVTAPDGIDVAFGLTAIGPDGAQLIQRADFVASDDLGRPVSASIRLVPEDDTSERATLLVTLDPGNRPLLCERTFDGSPPDWPVRLTVRDQVSGVLVQGVVPDGWCAV